MFAVNMTFLFYFLFYSVFYGDVTTYLLKLAIKKAKLSKGILDRFISLTLQIEN